MEQITLEGIQKDKSNARIEKARKLIMNNEWVPTELCLPQTRTGSPVDGGIKYLVTVQEIRDPTMRYVRLAYYYPKGSRKMDYEDTLYETDEWKACDWDDLINNKYYYISAWKPAPEAYNTDNIN